MRETIVRYILDLFLCCIHVLCMPISEVGLRGRYNSTVHQCLTVCGICLIINCTSNFQHSFTKYPPLTFFFLDVYSKQMRAITFTN